MRRSTVLSLPLKLALPAFYSTADLLVLTSLDQLIFILKILFAFVTLMRRSTVLSHPPRLVFPAFYSTVDLNVLTSLDQLIFILKYIIYLCYFNEEVNCTEPFPLS